MSKMTIRQLKDKLRRCTQDEMIALVTHLYKSNPAVADYLNVQFAEEDYAKELLVEKKNAIHKLFFPSRLRSTLSLREAKKVVSEFQKVCNDPILVIDLQLYYVECGIEFTNTYGDISEAFYNSMESMFWKVTDTINKLNSEEIYKRFEERLKKAVNDTDGIGWGFHDTLCDAVASLNWYEK